MKHFTSTYAEGFSSDYRQPCVVFCGHPSLRFGDAVHFVQLWGNNPQHTIIFTGVFIIIYYIKYNDGYDLQFSYTGHIILSYNL